MIITLNNLTHIYSNTQYDEAMFFILHNVNDVFDLIITVEYFIGDRNL